MTRLRGIRFRLLVAVNTAMALLLLVFLFVDYRREIATRVSQKHIALEEEAKTLLPAVLRLRPEGTTAIQEYVDAVCSQMQDAASPGHHISVRLEGTVLQAMAHGRESSEMFAAMLAAAGSPTHQSQVGDEALVVGSSHCEDIGVYVSEYLSDIQRSARRQALLRLAGIVLLTAVATGVVNVVFVWMAAKPLERLVGTVRQIARGQLGVQAGPFKTAELEYLAGEVNSMSRSLAQIDQDRRQQMDKARHIQEHLLPHEVSIPGLAIAHLYQPAVEIAGDYYDIVALPDGSWLLCIADVTGHGVPAAMTAAMLKALLMHAAEHHAAPAKILRFINDRFAAVSLDGDFATMMLARWVPEAGRLEYASAGHGNAWCLSSDGGTMRELPSTGLPLGVQSDADWEMETLPVARGERLLLITDGVTEAFDSRGEQFGGDRVTAILTQCKDVSLTEMLRRIDETVRAHRAGAAPTDDCTVVAVEFTA
ncbi:MAG: PP2C family protein-serine/threonine phosphatase [Pirellulales bacterium]